MADLLIHSMAEFGELILDVLAAAKARTLAEIGAEFGGMSTRLAQYCHERGAELISIDPSPKPEFLVWAAAMPHVHHIARPSLEAMPELGPMDAWVIDGDHNYYTVFHELALASANAQEAGRPLLAILHDVGWPCARRDMYYAPERIPTEFRHPHSYDVGVTLDSRGSIAHRGFRGGGFHAWALEAGGARNGVLTAVEDFIAGQKGQGRDLRYAHVPAVFGLGVVYDGDAPWAADVARILAPYDDNLLLARLEENRLRNYLAVIDWQDRAAVGG
ncbi:class I SAM-dependent methyltransferase [Novosphingobium sp. SG707]|uniref:class I SAM-dependent methyltransferase n=1 Tax=Novosphingobium sp. SG707 TaxID=2586996 RepID=UPI0014470B98|nr:class I SAM-dependent methyltransferase [Novosphingobium sp. SG707]NKI99018.1 hypothetical protein [Novosphingobium sp. SG707]